MKKKISIMSIFAILVISLIVLTGCGNNGSKQDNNDESSSNSTKEEIKGNYDVFEAIKKVETTQSYEEINSTMGFEGKDITSETANGWKKYEWEITDDTSLIATIYSTDDVEFQIEYPDEMIKNNDADFTKVAEFKSKINSDDGLKYEEFVEAIGCEGTLDKKSNSQISYSWVNSDGGTLHASFYVKSGKCTIYNGVY